jgi:hypothetical protein
LPNEVGYLLVDIILLHDLVEKPCEVLIVRLRSKVDLAAVLHELLDLHWLVLAELIKGDFLLFLFDILIFFCLTTAWQALPRKAASQKV